MTRRTSHGLVLGWATILVGVGWLLMRVGHGALAPPPGGAGVIALRQWASTRDAPTMTMSALRVVALLLDGYLLATIVLGTVARATRCARAVRVADVITPRSVRRLLTTAVGGLVLAAPISTAVSTVVGSPIAVIATPSQPAPQVRVAGGPPLARAPHGDPPLLRLVITGAPPGPRPARSAPPPTTEVEHRSPPPPRAAAPPPLVGPTEWIVGPGDNFWRIATLLLAAGQPASEPTAAGIAPYWRVLIGANRDRLRTGNPNLIYAGQRLVIPHPPPR